MEQAARLRKKKKQERFLTIAAIVGISAVVLCTVFFVVQGAMRKSVPKSDTERILGSWQEEGGRIQWTFDNSRVQVCALDEDGNCTEQSATEYVLDTTAKKMCLRAKTGTNHRIFDYAWDDNFLVLTYEGQVMRLQRCE